MLQGVAMSGIAGLDDALVVGDTDYIAFLRVEAHLPIPLPLLQVVEVDLYNVGIFLRLDCPV
jgi:hypothetical protein